MLLLAPEAVLSLQSWCQHNLSMFPASLTRKPSEANINAKNKRKTHLLILRAQTPTPLLLPGTCRR